jgi:hypothetical protein
LNTVFRSVDCVYGRCTPMPLHRERPNRPRISSLPRTRHRVHFFSPLSPLRILFTPLRVFLNLPLYCVLLLFHSATTSGGADAMQTLDRPNSRNF